MSEYKVLKKQVYQNGIFSIIPIRKIDRHQIMTWRNEQIHHLRQEKPLSLEEQDQYFEEVIDRLFCEQNPSQILFSYMKNNHCIGYGGLVHINWTDRNAEISFLMNTELEIHEFELHWRIFLDLLQKIEFITTSLHKIYIYAFDIRPHLYPILTKAGFFKDAELKDHCRIDNRYYNVVIYSKILD